MLNIRQSILLVIINFLASNKDPIITLDDEEEGAEGEQDGPRRSARSRRDHDV